MFTGEVAVRLQAKTPHPVRYAPPPPTTSAAHCMLSTRLSNFYSRPQCLRKLIDGPEYRWPSWKISVTLVPRERVGSQTWHKSCNAPVTQSNMKSDAGCHLQWRSHRGLSAAMSGFRLDRMFTWKTQVESSGVFCT